MSFFEHLLIDSYYLYYKYIDVFVGYFYEDLLKSRYKTNFSIRPLFSQSAQCSYNGTQPYML